MKWSGIWVAMMVMGSSAALAESGLSDGGGNVVVCFSSPAVVQAIRTGGGDLRDEHLSQVTSIEAFDLYEAKLRRGFGGKKPILAELKEGESFIDYVKRINERAARTIPGLSEIIEQGYQLFPSSNIVMNDHGVRKVDDINSAGTIDVVNCVVATAIVQQKINDQHFMHVDERLFYHPKHTEWSRAVLLLHEYIYRYGREQGQVDSLNTRKLVAALIGNNPETRLFDIIDLALSLGFLQGKKEVQSLEYYMHSAPVLAYRRIIGWMTYSITEALRDASGEEYEFLINSANILTELKSGSYVPSLTQAVGNLNEAHSQSKFEKLKNPAQARDVLRKGFELLDKRAQKIEASIRQSLKLQSEELELDYLTPAQTQKIQVALEGYIQRVLSIAQASQTTQKVDFCRQGGGPGTIRFDSDVGVCEVEDLNAQVQLGNAADSRRVDEANKWVHANARVELLFHAKFADEISAILFPALK